MYLNKHFFRMVWPTQSQIRLNIRVLVIHLQSHLILQKGSITKTHLFTYMENFTTKIESFQIKILIIFHISAHNMDCGYCLEPPHWGDICFWVDIRKLMYTPINPRFSISVGFKKGLNYTAMFLWCSMERVSKNQEQWMVFGLLLKVPVTYAAFFFHFS